MRITQPRDGPEKDNWLLGRIVHEVGSYILANLLILGWLTLSVGRISVHIVSINCTRHFGDKEFFLIKIINQISENSMPNLNINQSILDLIGSFTFENAESYVDNQPASAGYIETTL